MNKWAIKWGIPYQALVELRQQFGIVNTDPIVCSNGGSESAIQTRIRLEASRKGGRLWRNNLGVMIDINGNHIRYGLCNDSKKMNNSIKSHDLIGIIPIKITTNHVGSTVGQFTSREVKPKGWSYSGTPRERAQLRFAELVASLGGNASFATDEGTLLVDLLDNKR